MYRSTVHSISVDLPYRELDYTTLYFDLYCIQLYLYYSINGSCYGSPIDRSCARFAAPPCIAQELQDEFVDLVPNHRTDGDSVEKFFQRASPLMTAAQPAA